MEKQANLELIYRYFSDFTPTQQEQFARLGTLYTKWNEKINVISRKDVHALYEKHILHSLSIAAMCNFHSGGEILDIGTGGGFPGIPLAIYFPEVQFFLVDSIGKKIRVVQEISDTLKLSNVVTVHSRVEELKGRSFDFAVTRAVAPLKDLWKWSRPLLRKGKMSEEFANGLFCLKGGDLTQEIFQSGLRPHQFPIRSIFDIPSFEEKFLLYIPK